MRRFSYLVLSLLLTISSCDAKLSSRLTKSFYDHSCPSVFRIVKKGVKSAIRNDTKVAAALLRLHFHDCFVDGCDGSVLLDDTSTMMGEKNARPNQNSLDGFDVVDAIKLKLESVCPRTVSCADILAIIARDAVVEVHGPSWDVKVGRRDSLSANISKANIALPFPFESLATIITKFASVGLSEHDVASLSGAHTIGQARCASIAARLYNFNSSGHPDPSLSTSYLHVLQAFCGPQPIASSSGALINLDVSTPDKFDNKYFKNLKASTGLLASDQLLTSPGASTIRLVKKYATDQKAFFRDFAKSMVKMGNISPLIAPNGQIRANCRFVNV